MEGFIISFSATLPIRNQYISISVCGVTRLTRLRTKAADLASVKIAFALVTKIRAEIGRSAHARDTFHEARACTCGNAFADQNGLESVVCII